MPIFDEFIIAGYILVIKDELSKKIVPQKLVENDIEGFFVYLNELAYFVQQIKFKY